MFPSTFLPLTMWQTELEAHTQLPLHLHEVLSDESKYHPCEQSLELGQLFLHYYMHFGITFQKWMDVNNSYQCYIDVVNVGDFENSVIFQVEDISIWPHRVQSKPWIIP